MNEWEKLSNSEIRNKMSSMENKYESIKMKINNLIGELDLLDIEYNKAKKEIEKRSKI
jgi:peptidoglycan hydrolase CwlO-like protein